jgi:S-adenosylmethionine uptake transporter
MSRRGYQLMLLSALFFALMALCVGLAHRAQPTLSTAMTSFVRAVVNLLILLIFSWRHPLRLLGDRRAALWVRGIFGAMALLAYFASLQRIGLGEAAFLNQTSAAWVALLAPWYLREKTGRWNLVAVAGSLLGMFLLSVPRAGPGGDAFGRLLGAWSGLSAAVAYISVSRAGASNSAQVIVFYFSLVATAVSTGILLTGPVEWPQSPLVWLTLVGVGVCATLGQLFMTMSYRIGPAAPLAVVANSGPVLTSLLGWLVLQQAPDGQGLVGMLLILLSGVALPWLRLMTAERRAVAPPVDG